MIVENIAIIIAIVCFILGITIIVLNPTGWGFFWAIIFIAFGIYIYYNPEDVPKIIPRRW